MHIMTSRNNSIRNQEWERSTPLGHSYPQSGLLLIHHPDSKHTFYDSLKTVSW